MSDVPELDKLLEEAENVRRNKKWARNDRLFRHTIGYMLLSVLLIFPAGLLFGPLGAVVIAMCFILSILPALCLSVYDLLSDCFTDPPPRDPTKRYNYK